MKRVRINLVIGEHHQYNDNGRCSLDVPHNYSLTNIKNMRRHSYYSCVILFVMVLAVVACSGRKRGFDESKYPLTALEFQELHIEPLLGRPQQIDYIDSILVITDLVESHTLLLYDLRDSSYVRTLPVGNGPGEVSFPIQTSVIGEGENLGVFLRQTGEFRVYAIDSLMNNSFSFFEKVNLDLADHGLQTIDGYAGIGFYADGILRFFNSDGSVKQIVDLYSEYDIQDGHDKYRLFQGILAYNEKKSSLVIAPVFASVVLFYHYINGTWQENARFQMGEGNFEKRILNDDNLNILRSDVYQFITACSSKEYFYLLYDGHRMDGTDATDYRLILCFDTSGTLMCVYKVNPSVTGICVQDNVMYALLIGEDGEYTIGEARL